MSDATRLNMMRHNNDNSVLQNATIEYLSWALYGVLSVLLYDVSHVGLSRSMKSLNTSVVLTSDLAEF